MEADVAISGYRGGGRLMTPVMAPDELRAVDPAKPGKDGGDFRGGYRGWPESVTGVEVASTIWALSL